MKYFLFFIIFFSPFYKVLAQDKKTIQLFEKGKNEFMNRDYRSALETFNHYLLRDTTNKEVYYRIGQIYASQKNEAKASEFYLKTIQNDSINKNYINAYSYLGSRLLEKNEFEVAKKYLQISLANTNKNSIVYQQILKQLRTCDFGLQAIRNPLKIKPIPLNTTINAKERQYFPVLTADNATMIFTARDNNSDENIYVSNLKNNEWTKPESISDSINTPYNEGTCSISSDGKIMVFTSCEGRESFGSCDLFISKKIAGKWSKPENLGSKVNSRFWDSQPSLSSDGSKLYFSSERPYGLGGKDIWMSELDANNAWKQAINLGPKINTSQDEVSPFIHANGYSLFYSSNGLEGMGKFDIYMVSLKDKANQEPLNLGYPINTMNDELSLFITADGKNAYYSLDKENKVTLYEFTIPEVLSEKIDKAFYIKGFVIDKKTQKPLYSTIELLKANTGEKISKFSSDPITGDYMAILPAEGKYTMYFETPDYLYKSVNFDFSLSKPNNNLDINLEKIEKETVGTLNNIYFDTGSAALKPESNAELMRLFELLQKNPKLKIEISGHTDDVGNDNFNMDLSKKRALAVQNFLIEKGVDKTRMQSVGYGETKPKAKNDSDENRQLNRRIEFKFI